MRRWFGGVGLVLVLLGCGDGGHVKDPAEVRRAREAEIARLEEQVKSYDLLNSITADPAAKPDPEAAAKRREIDTRLAELRAEVER